MIAHNKAKPPAAPPAMAPTGVDFDSGVCVAKAADDDMLEDVEVPLGDGDDDPLEAAEVVGDEDEVEDAALEAVDRGG